MRASNILIVALSLVLLAACGRKEEKADTTGQKSKAEATASFLSNCERRLVDRKGLTSERADRLCRCFVEESTSIVPIEELESKMYGDASRDFKTRLQPALDRCAAK